MSVLACPVTTIAAPVERVWALVIDPRHVGAWSGVAFEAAEPVGPAHAGQRWRYVATGFGRRWRVRMTVTSVAAERHQLGLDIALPFGMRNEEHIRLARLAEDQTWVQFN